MDIILQKHFDEEKIYTLSIVEKLTHASAHLTVSNMMYEGIREVKYELFEDNKLIINSRESSPVAFFGEFSKFRSF